VIDERVGFATSPALVGERPQLGAPSSPTGHPVSGA
jgi:hypothetical protein